MAAKDEYIKELTDELSRQKAEKDAIIKEFTQELKAKKEWTPEDLQRKFLQLMPDAYATIRQVVLDGDNTDTLKFKAAQYITSICIGVLKITDDNDPDKDLKDLINSLKPSQTQTNDEGVKSQSQKAD